MSGAEGAEYTYARRASGLVRGLSLWDTFAIGLMTIQPIYGIWYVIQVGVGLFPHANLLIALALSAVSVGFSSPLVWGILGASMPRSGGEYIYNSRILHPAIALGASFANEAAVIYWNFFISSWVASPSLAILAQYMGWTGLANFVANKYGVFTLAMACFVAAFLAVAFGVKYFKLIQWPMLVIGIAGPIILAVVLSICSKAAFIQHWNTAAAKYHSLTYHAFVSAAGTAAGAPMPRTWNWTDTIGVMSVMFTLFIYAYACVYLSGEVKRPDKTVFQASWLAIVIPVAIVAWTFAAIYHLVDFNFLSAAAHNDLFGDVKGYAFPYSTSYMTLAYLASGRSWVIAVVASLTFLFTSYWVVVIDILLPSRAIFAWGMDRMGPKWFTDINPRWASPVKNQLLFTCIGIVGTACYLLWFTSELTGLVATGMQLVSVFLVTGIAAIVFPYRKKVRGIWESSPYRRWKVAGVPLITIAGTVYVAFIGLALYYAFFAPQTRDINARKAILFVCAWAAGLLWYYIWKSRSAKVGIDVSMTYGELPPE